MYRGRPKNVGNSTQINKPFSVGQGGWDRIKHVAQIKGQEIQMQYWMGGYLVKNTTDIRIDVIFYD